MPDITAGYTYTDTSGASYTVNHSNLNALIGSASINTGVITTAKLDDGSVTNVKVDSAAAIAHSKLASLTDTYVLVGNGSNVPTAVDVTGDVTITNAGVTAIGTDKVLTANILDDNVTADKLANTTVTAASYTNASLTVDAQGRLTAASSGTGVAAGDVLKISTQSPVTDTTFSTDSTAMVDITGLAHSITPSADTSTVLVQVMVTFGAESEDFVAFGLKRGGVQQEPQTGATGTRRNAIACSLNAGSSNATQTMSFQYMDSPSSTSSVTYQVTVSNRDGYTFHLNRSLLNTDAQYTMYGISAVTLTEVAG